MTRYLAHLTKGFVFVNLGITFGPLFWEYGDSIANIGHQLSLLHFWRGLHVPICTQLVISLEQQVSLTKQEDGIPDLPSYLAFFLFNGLCVSTSHVSSLIHSKICSPRWRFVTMANPKIIFSCWIGLRCNSPYLVRPLLRMLEFFSHWYVLCHAERKFVAQPMQVWFYSIHPINCTYIDVIQLLRPLSWLVCLL